MIPWYVPVFLLIPAVFVTWDLCRIRRKAKRFLAEAEAHEKDARILYEAAREVYADANARWSYVVQIEGRVH